MRFQQQLKEYSSKQLWQEYCGFMDLDIDEYMNIQNRLMTEQINVWSESGLGKSLLKGKKFKSKFVQFFCYFSFFMLYLFRQNVYNILAWKRLPGMLKKSCASLTNAPGAEGNFAPCSAGVQRKR